MIVDTSAIIAILRGEPDRAAFALAMEHASVLRMSAATYLEAGIVFDAARDPVASRRFDDFLTEGAFIIEPVTRDQARIAREAYWDFGRGSGHPAKLDFGDCFSYALAKALGEPLLFKGDDFARTDIVAAIRDATAALVRRRGIC